MTERVREIANGRKQRADNYNNASYHNSHTNQQH